jgi:hypothetical protein
VEYPVALDETSFYLSIVLLITNQFVSVQKMKLPKGRVISEDDVDGRLSPHGFHLIDVLPKAANPVMDMIPLTSYLPCQKFLLPIKMTQGDIL